MKNYSKFTFWQNISRQKKLIEYRTKLEDYFRSIDYNSYNRSIIDTPQTKKMRTYLSKQADIVGQYVIEAGCPLSVTYTPPPAIGGYIQNINLIDNLFNLQNYDLGVQTLIDITDQALGIYERDFKNSIIRTFNPFFWLEKILELISSLPFYLLGSVGFNRLRLEASDIGKLVKFIIKVITIFVSLWKFLAIFKIVPQEMDVSYFRKYF